MAINGKSSEDPDFVEGTDPDTDGQNAEAEPVEADDTEDAPTEGGEDAATDGAAPADPA